MITPWFLYPAIVSLLAIVKLTIKPVGKNAKLPPGDLRISIIIAAYNEEKNIQSRIKNIWDCNYDKNLIEIIVGSDGSNDNTVAITKKLARKQKLIKLVESKKQIGKAYIHNETVKHATGDILLFTDADTEFDLNFLQSIANRFNSNKKIGYVSGRLIFHNRNTSHVTQNSDIFWRFEQWLRHAETVLGIYMAGTGACSAVRASLFVPLSITGDTDSITPMDVVAQGYKCFHEPSAIAYDEYPETEKKEFNARVRISSKNILARFQRWNLWAMLKKPIYAITLIAHKYLRWFFPLIFLILTFFAIIVQTKLIISYLVIGGGFLFFFLAALHLLAKKKISKLSLFYNFVLVNIAFLVGTYRVITGNVSGVFTPTNKID
ncbi:MAG: glycosyltransferase [Leptospirales bacterium]